MRVGRGGILLLRACHDRSHVPMAMAFLRDGGGSSHACTGDTEEVPYRGLALCQLRLGRGRWVCVCVYVCKMLVI